MSTDSVIQSIVAQILAIRRDHPVRVAFDGIDAAGKTTLADAVAQALVGARRQVIRASIDGFHNPRAVRYRRGDRSPAGYYHASFQNESLIKNLLGPLGPGGSRRYRTAVFDLPKDEPLNYAEQLADPRAILLFDGVFLQRPLFRAYWDYCIFIQVSFERALERALKRDLSIFKSAAALCRRYELRYMPGQQHYFEQCKPRESADLVIDNENDILLWSLK
jgi:uridine kinase